MLPRYERHGSRVGLECIRDSRGRFILIKYKHYTTRKVFSELQCWKGWTKFYFFFALATHHTKGEILKPLIINMDFTIHSLTLPYCRYIYHLYKPFMYIFQDVIILSLYD